MVLKTRDTDIGSMRNVPKDLVCVFVSHYNHHMIVDFITFSTSLQTQFVVPHREESSFCQNIADSLSEHS